MYHRIVGTVLSLSHFHIEVCVCACVCVRVLVYVTMPKYHGQLSTV